MYCRVLSPGFMDFVGVSGPIFILVFSLSPSAGSVWLNVLRGPLEVLGGAVTGVVLGYFLHYFPSRDQVCELQLYD